MADKKFAYLNFLKCSFCPQMNLVLCEKECSLTAPSSSFVLTEPATIGRYLCAQQKDTLSLIPVSIEHKAQVAQWVSLADKVDPAELNSYLEGRSFLVGEAFSLADLTVYYSTALYMAALGTGKMKKHMHFSRWFDQAQHSARQVGSAVDLLPKLVPVNIHTALLVPRAPKSSGPLAGHAQKGKKNQSKEAKKEGEKEKQEAKKDKKEANKAAKQQAKKEKKEAKKDNKSKKSVKGAEEKESGSSDLKPSALDIRVGKIVKVWEHPEADKLYCEEIDIGEKTVRQIASGLRPFYKLSEMENQRVLVLANLKGRNMVGFKSTGMVMCSSNDDHTEVKLVHPPDDAEIGERIKFDGLENEEPATPAQVVKKKIFEKLAPFLVTDAAGNAMFKKEDSQLAFKAGTGVCCSALGNGHVA